MFNTDAPILRSEDDLLGRSAFAKNLATAVLAYRETRSIAIGLYGAWGDGKTSLLNLILAELVNVTSENSKNKPPIILRFNPWNFSTQEQLISQFFKQLSLKLEMSNLGAAAKGIGEKLDLLSKMLVPAKFIPGIGEIVATAKGAIEVASQATKAASEALEMDLESMKEAIDRELAKLDRKIVITIDDIDRLTDIEIRQVFQLVKSLGDFKNTVYFLLFDRTVVANALNTAQGGNGLSYLEKIIQVPFELPAPAADQVLDLVLRRMTTIIQDVDEKSWNSRYWGNVLHGGFKYHFKNLRDADRFLSVFAFNFSLMGKELNPIDLAAVTGLQVFQPKLYSAIRENRALFLGEVGGGYGSGEAERTRLKTECDELLRLINGPIADHAVQHLKTIFPRLEYYYNNVTYSGSGMEWRRNGRVCSKYHFDKYFNLNIPKGDIPKTEIEELIAVSGDEARFRSLLLGFGQKGLAHKALDHLQDYTEEGISKRDIPVVIKVVLDEGDQFVERHSNSLFSFEFETSTLILRIVYQLLKRYKTHSERMKVFSAAAKATTKSVYTVCHQVAVMGQQYGKYGGSQDTLDECTVLKNDLSKLEKMTGAKIKKFCKTHDVLSHPKLANLLLHWRDWGKASECDAFVRAAIKNDDGLLNLVRAFTTRGYQTGMSDYSTTIFYSADPKSLSHWISADKLQKRLLAIKARSEYTSADDEVKKSVEAFVSALEGKKSRP